jgi:general secretion pathway protein F
MAAFSYRAIDDQGKVVKGSLEGDSERQVRAQLRAQKLKPISVDSVQNKEAQQQSSDNRLFSPRLKTKDLTLFTRQMASLIQSGMPLVEALQGVAKQSRKQSTQALVLQIRSRVLEGLSFAQALAEHPRSFDSMYRAMVNAGEQAGFLGPVLDRLADYTETSQIAKQKLTSAMVYPMVLMFVCVAIVIGLMVLVVPQLVTVFERAKTELPWNTKLLIATSDFLKSYGIYMLGVIVVVVVAFRRWLLAPANLQKWHGLIIKLPIIGHIIVQSDTARFAGTVSMLIDSGVPLLQGLRISSKTMNNRVLSLRSEMVAATVQEGSSLHRALDKAEVFPPLLVQMASSGEMNGTLAEQLSYAARSQERELDMHMSTALNILEPVTIIVMALVVGFIMYSILTPIFGMSDLL